MPSTSSGQYCIGSFNFIETELFPNNPSLLALEDDLDVDSLALNLNGNLYRLSSYEELPFKNKRELIELLGCFYDFDYDTDLIYGTVIQVFADLEIWPGVDRLSLVEYYDCGRRAYLLLTPKGLYRCYPSTEIDRETNALITVDEVRARVFREEYITEVDSNGFVDLIFPTLYETVTEQVLVKDAYDTLYATQVVFDTLYDAYLNYSTNCPEAIIQIDSFLHTTQEAYEYFQWSAPEFDLVSELVLGYTEVNDNWLYKRTWQNDSVPLVARSVRYYPKDLISIPDNYYFFNDILLDSIVQPSIDTFIGPYLLPCKPNYKAAGFYCYNETDITLSNYVNRSYLKLVQSALSQINEQDAKYTRLTLNKIANLEELDSSCINIDTIKHMRLVVRESPKLVRESIAAQYGTIEYQIPEYPIEIKVTPGFNNSIDVLTTHPETEVIAETKVNVPANYNNCHRRFLEQALFLRGYLQTMNPDDESYYRALMQLQYEGGFHLGVIDVTLIGLLR